MFQYSRYYVIHNWMIKCFKLKGLDLMVFAIIYGLCQYGDNHVYNGNNSFLVEMTGATRNGIQKSLKKLIDKDLLICIERKNKGQLFKSYKINSEKIDLDVRVQDFITKIK